MIKKDELLLALKTVLSEYQARTHKNMPKTCSLCQLYLQNSINCQECPMAVFKLRNRPYLYHCMNRKCRPTHCGRLMNEVQLQRCIEFYRQIIPRVEAMTEEELNAENAFWWMLSVDYQVANMWDITTIDAKGSNAYSKADSDIQQNYSKIEIKPKDKP